MRVCEQVSDWKHASDLVVTSEEYDDLVYLIDRERRRAVNRRCCHVLTLPITRHLVSV